MTTLAENTLLIELGTEELPPSDLLKLSLAFKTNFANELSSKQLPYNNIVSFATPRRLAIQVHGIATQQQPQTITRKGPALAAAFDSHGNPTNAALGFAASCKVTIDQLQQQTTPKGSWLYFSETAPGQTLATLFPEMLEKALTQLPISKRMRWGNVTQAFVRPVHWLVALLNTEILACEIFAIKANRYTYGHRFHQPSKLAITHANDYEPTLTKQGMVIANFQQRLALITSQATALATSAGGQLLPNNSELLELITGLVEYPVPLIATFAAEFLTLPKEVIIAAIQDHQKCLPIVTANGELIPKFILISNINSSEPQTIITGNELVMHARLADAAFLYQEDRKTSLLTNLAKLKTITFQAKLGTIYEKVLRITKLATLIAQQLGANLEHTTQAATLCKADLSSHLVYEFPELQGIIGYYYAKQEHNLEAIAIAIREHYLPKAANDLLPTTLPGICLALADRLDTLVGLFAINQIPSGEKDPFALKRQALAILRIIIEKSLPIDLAKLSQEAYNNYLDKIQNKTALIKLQDFFFERLRYWYLATNITAKTIAAISAQYGVIPLDFHNRLLAVQAFQQLPEAASLAAANKRVKNILTQAQATAISNKVEPKLLIEAAELQLYQALQQQEQIITPLLAQAKYQEILTTLASLKAPIDNFFAEVMVMVPDLPLQTNRLALLQQLHNLFIQIADISQLEH